MQQLIQCGQKFAELVDCHHCECYGPAFFTHKGEPLADRVDGRITVDGCTFFQMNPAYIGPDIDKSSREDMNDRAAWGIVDESQLAQGVRNIGVTPTALKQTELLTCSPTVFGFRYSNKSWRECFYLNVERLLIWYS